MTTQSLSAPRRARLWAGVQGLLIPLLSVITAILLGSVLILLDGRDPITAFEGLFEGAFLEPRGLLASFRNMTPLVLSGLAVAFAIKSGLFNIGVQGQLIVGSVVAAWVGFAFEGLPPLVHVTLALAASLLAGGLWAAIAGALKAYADAHEVITTIMLNYIAVQFAGWLISTGSDGSKPVRSPARSRSRMRLHARGDSGQRKAARRLHGAAELDLHAGIFVAIIAAVLIMFVLYRTTSGFNYG
jgi:simple sugar transport system permease protein